MDHTHACFGKARLPELSRFLIPPGNRVVTGALGSKATRPEFSKPVMPVDVRHYESRGGSSFTATDMDAAGSSAGVFKPR